MTSVLSHPSPSAMAGLNLYDMTVPSFISTLTQLSSILQKAESHTKQIKPSEARLAPDMLPLTFQIQMCSNVAKHTLVRVAGAPDVPMDDNETTFAELRERIEKTVELLKKAKKEDFEGKEDADVKYVMMKKDWSWKGKEYVYEWALPNFWFHASMCFAILRMEGVEIGKGDWLGDVKSGHMSEAKA